jgi:hypothetical protein
MQVRVFFPVFSSPTHAFGNARGTIDVAEAPVSGEQFPWPPAWLSAHPSWFEPGQGLVGTIGEIGVSLYGIVCWSVEEARQCAAFLQEVGDLEFDEYDLPEERNEA